jgi:hypothetical protein
LFWITQDKTASPPHSPSHVSTKDSAPVPATPPLASTFTFQATSLPTSPLTSTPLSALPSFQSPFNSTLPAFQTPTTPTTTSLTPVSESKAEKSKKATEAERDDDDQQQDEEAAEVVVEDTNNVPEGQELLHRSGRAKLYLFESGNREWKERGIGRVSVLKTIESGAVSPPNVFCFLSRFLIHSFPLISVSLSLSLCATFCDFFPIDFYRVRLLQC